MECWLGRYRHSEEAGVAFDVADRFDDCFEVASPHGAVVEVLGRGGCGGGREHKGKVKARGV